MLDRLGIARREIGSDSQELEALAAAGIPLSFLFPVLTDGERLIGYGRLSEKRLRKELGFPADALTGSRLVCEIRSSP